MRIKLLLAAGAMAIGASTMMMAPAAHAACGIKGGSISILGNEFKALQAITETAEECAVGGVEFSKNLTTEHRDLQVAALTANPAQYTAAFVANSSIVPLMNDGLIRPLDDLVAKYGSSLKKNQLITIDGKVMAVAFMANAQHLFYRQDVLEKAGIAPPKTYEEVVAAGKALKASGAMANPFAFNSATGWNLGEEFVNMYLGHGGQFFKPGSAEVAINNATGVATLTMMKQLTELSDPDFLTFDSNATQALWESGELALATLWGSRGGGILDAEGSTAEITGGTVLSGAPTVAGGSTPASTLWWDGFTIAKNISDEDAEATFIALVHGLSDKTIEANNDAAVWLSDAYKPGPAAAGVAETAQGGTKPYPMLPYMGLLHTALGAELSDFLQGKESAEQALADVEAAYTSAAKEQGFL